METGIDLTHMLDDHYFADVNLPNHVWVRERAGARARWVLRDAAELQLRSRGAAERLAGACGGSGEGSRSPRS